MPSSTTANTPAPELIVHYRNAARELIGQVPIIRKFSTVLRWADVSTWALELPFAATPPELLAAGGGIIVTLGDDVLLSGPLTSLEVTNDGNNIVTLGGVDDTAWLARRLCWPCEPDDNGDGSWSFPSTAIAGYVEFNGQAVLRDLIRDNVGATAFGVAAGFPRAVDGLTVPAPEAIGSFIKRSFRFDNLLDAMQSVALSAGDLGFRIFQTPGSTDLEMAIFEQRDLTATVRLGTAFNNLASFTLRQEAPAITDPIIGGQGEGTARVFVLPTSDDAGTWGRIEEFVDRRSAPTVGELQNAVTDILGKSGAAFGLTLNLPPDNAWLPAHVARYGRDFRLGDKVTVEELGVEFVEVVRQVSMSVGSGPPSITPALTSPGATGVTTDQAGDRTLIERLFAALRSTRTDVKTLESRS